MEIVLSGYPASGTTTLATYLVDKYSFTRIDAGDIVRDAAEARGMNLFQFDQLLRENEELDRWLDAEIRSQVAEHDRVVLESCYSGHQLEKVESHIWVTAPREERINRFAEREDMSVPKAMDEILSIEESIRFRAREFYGIDIENIDTYDAIIDTGSSTIAESFKELEEQLAGQNLIVRPELV